MHKDDTCPTCGHWRHTQKCDYSWCRCGRPDAAPPEPEEAEYCDCGFPDTECTFPNCDAGKEDATQEEKS